MSPYRGYLPSMLHNRKLAVLHLLVLASMGNMACAQAPANDAKPYHIHSAGKDISGDYLSVPQTQLVYPLASIENLCEGRMYGTHPDSTDAHCYLFCPGSLTSRAGTKDPSQLEGAISQSSGGNEFGQRGCCGSLLCYQNPEEGKLIGSCGECIPGPNNR